ncbi:MMPL family transporter [Phytohabitans houttuyneae]|uniref:Putative membrane protein n=1 Tax=Phytohabitans houttuyneae TaxID=1076126 RepID=A0A6V8KBM3_9ACTN|nr:MMPL family transporter [Phytohabitans houttuyneae]GFJ78185.1 putative membrane protein [Phytohabitans houttuyneae]
MLKSVTGFAIRRPRIVVVAWILALVAGFGIGIGVFERLTAEVSSGSGTESARGGDRIAATGPEQSAITAVVHGKPADDPAVRAQVDDAIADVRAIPGVVEVSPPQPSARTGEALILSVTLRSEDETEAAEAAAERLREISAAQVAVSGGPLTEEEYGTQAEQDVQRAEMLTTPVVLVLLLLIFGGLIAAGLPLLIAVAGVGGTFGILYGFSEVTDVSVYAIQVTTMMAVGLGVDYALLMVNRFREERAIDPDVRGAVTRTAASAGRTVLFAGLTVALALAGLVVFSDPFLRSMGFAGMAVVLVDMLAALTLLPALLVLLGRRIKPGKPQAGGGFFARVARRVQRRPMATMLVTAAALVFVALPALDLRLGLGDPRMLPADSGTRQLYDALSTHYPEGNAPDPIEAVVTAPSTDPGIAELRDRIAGVDGIARVEAVPAGADLTVLNAYPVDITPSDRTKEAVTAIRDLPAPFEVLVTGDAAHLVDYESMLVERAPWAIGVVVLGTLLLLFAFTGSVLLPIKAVVTNMLSIGAALGVVVWVFQDGNLASVFGTSGLGYLNLTVPVLVAAIAFGLSVDYEVFLLSRIRERWLAGVPADRAVAEGIQRTGRIITSAALLLVVVFAGFLVGGFVPIKGIGLGLVLAVAIDATVVRMLLVPATMTVLGRYNFWAPGPLRRLHKRIEVTEEAPAEREPALV